MRESSVIADFVSFGRRSDCDVQLPDPRIMLQQASILERDGRFYFISDDLAITRIIGEDSETNRISVGTVVELGPYELHFEAPENDADLAVAVELVSPLDDGLGRAGWKSGRHGRVLRFVPGWSVCWPSSASSSGLSGR